MIADKAFVILDLNYTEKDKLDLLNYAMHGYLNFFMIYHCSGKDFYIALNLEQINTLQQERIGVHNLKLTYQQLLQNNIITRRGFDHALENDKKKELEKLCKITLSYKGIMVNKIDADNLLGRIKLLRPNYLHYSKRDFLTVVEFTLVIHNINPNLYDQQSLSRGLMFVKTDRGFLEPEKSVPYFFQASLVSANETFELLNGVEWNLKYGSKNQVYLHKIPLDWLLAEAKEKQLDLPEELSQFVQNKVIMHKNYIFIKEKLTIDPAGNEKLEEANNIVEKEASDKKDKIKHIWENVAAELHQVCKSIQSGNKIDSSIEAITIIINAILKIRSDFDPMKMPGSVKDFFDFCKNVPNGQKIFSYSQGTFRKYCTGAVPNKQGKQKPSTRKPLCKWGQTAKPNSEYWKSLMPNILSYTVNQNTF